MLFSIVISPKTLVSARRYNWIIAFTLTLEFGRYPEPTVVVLYTWLLLNSNPKSVPVEITWNAPVILKPVIEISVRLGEIVILPVNVVLGPPINEIDLLIVKLSLNVP